MKERGGKGRERVRRGGGTEGGVKHCKAVSQSHEPGWLDGETSWKYLQTHSGRDFVIIEAEAMSEMHKTGETPPRRRLIKRRNAERRF